MLKKLILAGLAVAALITPLVSASAMSRPEFSVSPSATQVHWRRGWHGYRGWRPVYRPYRPVRFYGAPGYWRRPYVGYVVGGGCGWLHQRAIVTGNPYWWRRYHACIGW